nr:ATP-binding cassette sub-family A member 17-like [Saimiri boliviensis boliviensis]
MHDGTGKLVTLVCLVHHILHFCLHCSFMAILFCTEVKNVAAFKNSDPSLIFVFLMCLAIATIFFAFMISTFFQRAHAGTAVGGIIFFFTYLPYPYLMFSYIQRSYFQKIACCLFSNVAMALGVRFITIFEERGTGIQWGNMGSVRGEFNFTQVLLLLLLDSFLYCLIAWYVESIFPGKYGTPKPWYFFALPSYWHGKPVFVTQSLLDMRGPVKAPNSEFIQEEPTDLIKGIEIQHLYKLKGLSRQKCPEEVKEMLRIIGLEDKQNSPSRFLSGGMRHKLFIGIALIAGSRC